MGAQRNFKVKVLCDEVWGTFQGYHHPTNVKFVAEKVAKECGGMEG